MQTILIVDDMAVIRAPLAAALSAAGYRALTADCGQDALSQIQSDAPDLVLLDLTMPGMNGLSVLRQIRKTPATAQLPVILLTASSAKHLVLEAAEIGVQGYLVKAGPTLSMVVERVRKCLAGVGPPACPVPAATSSAGDAPASLVAASAPSAPSAPSADPSAADATPTSRPTAPRPSGETSLVGVPLLSREETTRRLERADFKSLPRAVIDLIGLIAAGTASVSDATPLLQREPVLFSRLLRIACAAAAATAQPQSRMTTLEEATKVLGPAAVQNLIVAVGVNELVVDRAGKGNPALWHHCLAVAALMEKLAPAANVPPRLAYVLGLCHELPVVALHQHFPKHARHANELAQHAGEPIDRLQSRIFGIPCAELMRMLLARLKLPLAVTAPLSQFFGLAAPVAPAQNADSIDPLARLLGVANALSHGLMFAPGVESAVAPLDAGGVAAIFGEVAPSIDAVSLRGEVSKMVGLLAETAVAGVGVSQMLEPVLPRTGGKFLYVRDQAYAGFDPLLALLEAATDSVSVHVGLDPLPTNYHDVDAMVVAAPAATPAAELVSLVQRVGKLVRGRPVLCLSAAEVARCDGSGADVKAAPFPATVAAIGGFLKAVSVSPTRAARAA